MIKVESEDLPCPLCGQAGQINIESEIIISRWVGHVEADPETRKTDVKYAAETTVREKHFLTCLSCRRDIAERGKEEEIKDVMLEIIENSAQAGNRIQKIKEAKS